jgi:DNA-binding transcriptional LysR family regulator
LLDAVLNGEGIILLPDFIVSDALHVGKLIPVLPECEFAALNIQIVHRTNRRLNKRMRALVKALQQSCAVLNASM